MTNKTVREYRKMFEKLGVTFEERVTGSGHRHYTVCHCGQKASFFFASTPSDVRALRNNRADVARFMREAEARS